MAVKASGNVAASSDGFLINVKGQSGTIPKIGLGTACMDGEVCVNAVANALQSGYKMVDTALLYGN